MCGIIGYIGSKPVVPVLLEGLRRMEYRGYDSAGVAVVSPEGIALRRSAGKLANLEQAIRVEPVKGLYGVGHTRWATHAGHVDIVAPRHRQAGNRERLFLRDFLTCLRQLAFQVAAVGIPLLPFRQQLRVFPANRLPGLIGLHVG